MWHGSRKHGMVAETRCGMPESHVMTYAGTPQAGTNVAQLHTDSTTCVSMYRCDRRKIEVVHPFDVVTLQPDSTMHKTHMGREEPAAESTNTVNGIRALPWGKAPRRDLRFVTAPEKAVSSRHIQKKREKLLVLVLQQHAIKTSKTC